MTCKDCLYFKRCVVLGVELDMEHDKKADENCRHFENKANVTEVKHGEWILKHIGAGHYWECSECHTNPCIYITKDTKYCPNCGARMDGE